MPDGGTIRIGAVNYLNTKPLVYGLTEIAPDLRLTFDLPSRLASGLAAGDYDIALIPSIEAFQDPGYRMVSDACIACRGPVLSVKLFCRVPPAEIKTLALDEGSRTSVALVRILLAERYGIQPQLQALPIGEGLDSTNADAVLLIGDRAIHSPPGQFAAIWDLGDEWRRWAGRPFVFAAWTARPGVDTAGIDAALSAARDAGCEHLDDIAGRYAAGLGMTQPQCLSYLRDNLYFRLGPREQSGLALFYEHAARLGLAPSGLDLDAACAE